MKFKTMKRTLLIITAALALAAFVTGCSTTSTVLTPAVIQQAVTISVEGGLLTEPQAAPEVKIAGAVICASASATNVAPASIVASLQAAGLTNNLAEATLIVNGALLIYEVAYNSIVSTNDQAAAQPYLQAVCDGINAALPAPALAKSASAKKVFKLTQDWSQIPVRP